MTDCYQRDYDANDGMGIKGILNNKQVAWIERLQFQTSRQKFPVYTMENSPKPTVAGSLRLFQFDSDPWYPDQIPPFDIIYTTRKEQGCLLQIKILDVELLNNGFGVSSDDIVSEHWYQFIARGIVPWVAVDQNHKGQIYNEYTKKWSWL